MSGRSNLSTTDRLLRGAVLASLLTLGSCTFGDVLGSAKEEAGEPQTRITSDLVQSQDPQAPIGKAEHPAVVKANGGAYEDPKLEALLAVVVAELVAAQPPTQSGTNNADGGTPEPAHSYRITILDSDSVNAFALPGGYLYVTRGLIALANDASEVAAVLSHEMAHVSASHGVERIIATRASDIAAKVASNVVTDGATKALATASSDRKLASFSQRQELEADHLGIRRAGAAGFDPRAAVRFLESMRRWSVYRSGAGGSSGMASTHPSTPERVELARAHAARVGPAGTGQTMRDRYLEGIDGLVFGDRASQGFVRGQTYSHKKLGVAFAVPKGFKLRNKGEAALATGPGETAVRFDAVPRADAPKQNVADYIASGWVSGIEKATIRTAKRSGMDLATARASAGAFDFGVAVFADDTHFYRFITAAPKGSKALAPVSRSVSASFRSLSDADVAALKPLRLRVVTVGEGDNVASLSKRMATGPGSDALLRALNGLDAGEEPQTGSRVKIVSSE